MNTIREIQELNKRELENNVSISASWHNDYRDTAYVYIGGLPFTLSEGDVLTIFSQFGEPTYVNLIRDKETGKSKGFAFLKYEDQRSCDLAVDNLGGATIMGKMLKVDHTRYKRKEGEEEEEREQMLRAAEGAKDAPDSEEEAVERRPLLKEEVELQKLLINHDDDDPMKEYLVKEKKEEVATALAALQNREGTERKHKHRHHHRSRRDGSGTVKVKEEDRDRRRHRHHHSHRRRSRSP